ncbi:microfibril-associated glycoprotein 4-like [Asterias amurensis]|uniref:microfibril-associated glycoprotein 4-like n=1 Tax=Asterias amurensis TaxID=7602 RepID=UPI003AB635A4
MGVGWMWNVIVAGCFVTVTWVSARMCVLGTEPDESFGGKVRFVLPPGDPCSCTELKLGGHNSYAPPRNDKPVYIDNLPMDAEGLRKTQGCPEESTRRESTQMSTSKVETSDLPTTRETLAPVVYTDCQDAFNNRQTTSGVYTIEPYGVEFDAYCDMTTEKGYIVIQKRFDGSVDFNKNWADYQNGFGDLNGESWLGNEKLHQITSQSPKYELLVTLTAFDGSVAQARYSDFSVKSNEDNYEINPSSADTPENTVSAGNGLESKQFSTFDHDHDDGDLNCAELLSGGWWFSHCSDSYTPSNLNGVYSDTPNIAGYLGIYWTPWNGYSDVSLKATEMKIRCLEDC